MAAVVGPTAFRVAEKQTLIQQRLGVWMEVVGATTAVLLVVVWVAWQLNERRNAGETSG
ncbi:hypothetical protein [Salicola sp. Rm-C-2C1-2]|uniref:hypothetical protein n=1 Tax=Salicola sp. Rm-C-2C1-2 TaxID=3141321 RepID=UPI0032E40D24